MSLDETECDNIEDVPFVKDPEVGTHLFDPTTGNVDDACDSEDNSEWHLNFVFVVVTIICSRSVWSTSRIFVSYLWTYAKEPKMSSCVPNKWACDMGLGSFLILDH